MPQQSYLANCHPNVILYGSKLMKGLQVHTNLERVLLHVDKSNDVALYEQQEISGEAMAGIIKERKDSLGYAARCTRSMRLLLGSSLVALLLQRSICTAFRCTTFLLSQHPVYLLLSILMSMASQPLDLPAALTCGLKVVIHQKSNRVYPAGIARESRHSESHIPRRACMHRMPWQRSSVSSLICTSCRATEGGNIRPLAERLRSRVYLGASSRYKEPCHV